MLICEDIMAIPKSELQEASKRVNKEEIPQLVEWLSQKDDKIRYQAFLLLQNRSSFMNDVYPYWEVFQSKLKSDNSYQRSIGLMLIAENVKWDTENKMTGNIDEYLALLNDEKPITIRQCIQSLGKIATYASGLNEKIAGRLTSFDLMVIKETMRKSVLQDILHVLLIIRKGFRTDEMDAFILNALSGEILDNKTKKQITALL